MVKIITVLLGRIPAKADKTGEIGFALPNDSTPMQLSFEISNNKTCSDQCLKPTFFYKPITILLTDETGASSTP
jgi:hypothetical protein